MESEKRQTHPTSSHTSSVTEREKERQTGVLCCLLAPLRSPPPQWAWLGSCAALEGGLSPPPLSDRNKSSLQHSSPLLPHKDPSFFLILPSFSAAWGKQKPR